jgi:hypothetical protein
MKLYQQMRQIDLTPNEHTFSIVLSGLAEERNLIAGKEVHKQLEV